MLTLSKVFSSDWNRMSAEDKLNSLSYNSSTPVQPNFKRKEDFKKALERESDENEAGEDGKTRAQWLVDIRDSKQRSVGHPDYDPTTLYIPPDAKLTAAKEQYWNLKKKSLMKLYSFNKVIFIIYLVQMQMWELLSDYIITPSLTVLE